MKKYTNALDGLGDKLGYNPYRDTQGRFDDGPQLLASRGRPKVSATDQRKKIDEAKERLKSEYSIAEPKEDREKVLDGPKYLETPGFQISENTMSAEDVRTILWRDKDLFPGQTYGQYYADEKARKGDIFMMTAADYRQALVESGQYEDITGIERRMDWEKVDQYTEDMQSGDKFPPGQLIYDKDGDTQQEGLHRVYAAERVGIEEIPVVVSSDTRNQDIYPYTKLSNKILSQDEILGKKDEVKTVEAGKLNDGIVEQRVATILGEIKKDGLSPTLMRLKMQSDNDNGFYDSVVERLSQEDDKSVSRLLDTLAPKKAEESTAGAVDYRMSHTAPHKDDEISRPGNDLEEVFPDVYDKSLQYYPSGFAAEDKEMVAILAKMRDNPDAEVTMYRAVPDYVQSDEITDGDWVTLTEGYAKEHGESNLDGKYKILKKTVKASEVYSNGDSIQEWGYSPEPESKKKTNSVEKVVANQISARDFEDIYKDIDIDTDNLGCIMLDLEPMEVMDYLPLSFQEELFENPKWDQGSVPAETVPHVTLLYGLLENGNKWKSKVDKLLEDWRLNDVYIEEVGFFETPDSYAVVAHLLKTPELIDGHERLTLLPHINTFSEYKPHMTLAYVKLDADVEEWVRLLGEQYNGKTVKAVGINYGDKESDDDDDSEDNATHDITTVSLSSLGQEHNSVSQAGLIVAHNALDADSRDIIQSQENALRDGFSRIEQRMVAIASDVNNLSYLTNDKAVFTNAQIKKFEQDVDALLNTFYINLYPIFGRQLLSKRASEYGELGTYEMTEEAQAYISEMAAKAAASHVATVMKDIMAAAAIAYGLIVVAQLTTLIVAALAAGNLAVSKKFPDNPNPSREDVERAVEDGVFNSSKYYKEAQRLAREGQNTQTISNAIKAKYPEISNNRAKTIARTESARVFNQSQFEADRQFLNSSGLMPRAYKKLRSRTGTPCVHCKLLIDKPPIPFLQNFADLGTVLSATESKEDGSVKVKSLPINWDSVKAGNVHPNCNCEYVLIIKD